MRFALVSFVVLGIISAIVYFHNARKSVPVAEVTPVIKVTPVKKEIHVEKIPGPFLYAEAVIPSFVPAPKPRPHHRRRRLPLCKPVALVAPALMR